MLLESSTRLPVAIVSRLKGEIVLLSQINATRASYISLLPGHDPDDDLSCWVAKELVRLDRLSEKHFAGCIELIQLAMSLRS